MSPGVRRGLFITIEGGDGCGKSTHTARLARWLRRRRCRVHVTREPGGTLLGERLRRALLESQGLDPWAETLLFQALRAQHVTDVIRPKLERGWIVVCDRFADSTMAYQGYGLGVDRTLVARLTRAVSQGATPDLTVILDAPAAAALRRVRRAQHMERRGMAYQRRVLAGFRAIARREPGRCRVIVVEPTPAATQRRIRQVVEHVLQRRGRASAHR